jgi:hypothetical protein
VCVWKKKIILSMWKLTLGYNRMPAWDWKKPLNPPPPSPPHPSKFVYSTCHDTHTHWASWGKGVGVDLSAWWNPQSWALLELGPCPASPYRDLFSSEAHGIVFPIHIRLNILIIIGVIVCAPNFTKCSGLGMFCWVHLS